MHCQNADLNTGAQRQYKISTQPRKAQTRQRRNASFLCLAFRVEVEKAHCFVKNSRWAASQTAFFAAHCILLGFNAVAWGFLNWLLHLQKYCRSVHKDVKTKTLFSASAFARTIEVCAMPRERLIVTLVNSD
ncbi:hypothetical protein E8K88_13450 [Lampropedia aestuarii]|uniref:Uncharacterized protein n=1 Tax=Lampropedia aestuarii TaxID=2562762 RepID=A0A4S5BIQ1_9BURK|nr:hypothetical protein [Lampropedia aestuarii]MDH5858374.1 hypothetical protein [Lampropedia aestuarii]THJ32029.1 hypothetical protein E8K88_13450 [Lampropedia aestuarii]